MLLQPPAGRAGNWSASNLWRGASTATGSPQATGRSELHAAASLWCHGRAWCDLRVKRKIMFSIICCAAPLHPVILNCIHVELIQRVSNLCYTSTPRSSERKCAMHDQFQCFKVAGHWFRTRMSSHQLVAFFGRSHGGKLVEFLCLFCLDLYHHELGRIHKSHMSSLGRLLVNLSYTMC